MIVANSEYASEYACAQAYVGEHAYEYMYASEIECESGYVCAY